jgi:hypothetical protein
MAADPITGNTIRFAFSDGVMAGKTFEHTFGTDGGVTFREIGKDGTLGKAKKYEVVEAATEVYAVAYLSEAGHTLTTILDFQTKKLVAFASNEKQLSKQRGTFQSLGKMPV